MNQQPKSPSSLLESAGLQAVMAKLELHKALLARIRRLLPPPLAEHCRDCLVTGGRLVIFVDDPAWAFQARFFLPAIQTGLSSAGELRVTEIQVRNLHQRSPNPSAPAKAKPTLRTARAIKSCALEIGAEELKGALLRLAETIERNAG
jgi:hypothetical protein